jgi:ABC-type uncharacterized transport system permease subunit
MDLSIFLSVAFITSLVAAAVRLAMPVLLASLGEIFAELSGVMNMGLEGIMAVGAFVGFAVAYISGNVWIALLAAILSGALLGLFMAFLSVTVRLDQVVAGLAITLFGVGVSDFLYRQLFGVSGKPPRIEAMPSLEIPLLSDIPIIGKALFAQNAVVYLTVGLVVLFWFVINRMTWGLKVRAAGELPGAVQTAGTSVSLVRYVCVMIGAAMAGLAGGFLTVVQLGLYLEGIIAGRGWVSIVLVVFASWKPSRAVIGALIFGLADAVQFRLQALGPKSIPFEIFLMLPYVLTILALFVGRDRLAEPAALGKAYVQGER